MKKYYDSNLREIRIGDIIDNGQSEFVILGLNPLDIRYYYDLERKYEYDMEELLMGGDVEVIGTINFE